MKKILFIAACMLGILSSCTKSDIHTKVEKGDCLVTINPIGEISTSDNPLTKLGNNNGLYLIQVYQNDTTYAMGMYSNLNNVKVYLHKGLRYRFIVSAIGKTTYVADSSNSSYSIYSYNGYAQTKTENDSYYERGNYNCISNTTPSFIAWGCQGGPEINQVYYHYKCYYRYRSYVPSMQVYRYYFFKKPYFSNIEKAILEGEVNATNTNDWFYGEATFTPTGEYQTLDVNFKRVGYKLKYELDGVTDGDVTVTIKTQSGKVLIQNTTNTETYSGDAIFVPFYDIASVYQNPSSYFENLIVSVSWLRGIGVTQDLGSTTIQVKRNNLNRVRIHLGNSDAGAAMNLSTEAESMGAESTDITIE